jgi:hypothetical protein
VFVYPEIPPRKEVKDMVKLYRFVDGMWRHVDFGVPSKVHVYLALGYVVRLI